MQVLPPDTSEAFLCGSIFNETAFYFGEKQGMLVNDDCSFWYNRVRDSEYQCGIEEKNFCMARDQYAWPDKNNPTLKCVVIGTECYNS